MVQVKICLAPDRGWGWVIVFSSFMIHVIGMIIQACRGKFLVNSHFIRHHSVWGTAYTFGIFLNELMDTFNTSFSMTSSILSVQMGATRFVGPLAASLVKKFGCCKITVLGSMIAAVGLISSGFAPNIIVLFFSAGLCTGICYSKSFYQMQPGWNQLFQGLGFGLINLPAMVVVSTYFKKRKALACSIVSCGSGVGTLIMAPAIAILDSKFGWGYTLMMIGVLMSICVLLGLLFRPVETKEPERPTSIQQGETTPKINGKNNSSQCTNDEIKTWRRFIPNFPVVLQHAMFLIFLLSTFLTNLGLVVPYAYTVVKQEYDLCLE